MSRKSETYAAIWTAVAAILLFLLLFLCTIAVKMPDEEEGVEVNFGDVLESAGLYEPAPAEAIAEPAPVPPAAQPAPPAKAVEQPVKTQDFEESLAMKQAREQERKRKAEEQAAEKARLEQQRLEQQRLAEERRIAEEKAAKAAAISNRAKGAFGSGGAGSSTSASEGTGTSGSGNEGNPLGTVSKNKGMGTGSGSGNSASFSLGNRKIIGTIPRPSDNTQVVGKIVVEITVDAAGNVISATIGQGTTIAEASARSAALAAARKAKFTSGDRTEIGIITYNFKLE